ncbi:MAG: hypothetical protein CGW95_03840 [Phenylobacterium zucineum]|nr:MAG: hypothetical protein CGW95_03840 [Phenylobacterium zucineum]
MKQITSKHIDGISDLVVVAPIKDGFINAFETITYASRLELVATALNRIRVAAREYERIVPYSDVTERILSLLDFRVGVIDKNLFGMVQGDGHKLTLTPKRYLYLTATFDGGFEPYMRQIWRPLGLFLDLLFCNCDGYVTASEHSFDEYIQWVRDHQMDSAIFYNTTGVTVRDQKYLAQFERVQRHGDTDIRLSQLTMSYPDDDAAATRKTHFLKTVELGLEALNVLYKLTDYFPPEWMTGHVGDPKLKGEGHRLLKVTRSILSGWDPILAWLKQQDPNGPCGWAKAVLNIYKVPLNWYESGIADVVQHGDPPPEPDPKFEAREVQAGILKAHGSTGQPVRQGAVMLFTVREAQRARNFIKWLLKTKVITFEDRAPADLASGMFGNIAFTPQGLIELGMSKDVLDCFPSEFREGLAKRSGLVGDMRENHPRNWIRPERNGPAALGLADSSRKFQPVDLEEVDFVLQLRSATQDAEAFKESVLNLARHAAPGASLEAVEWLHVARDDQGRFIDHFGFVDGISQPRPRRPNQSSSGLPRDAVALGEVVLGYANDRGDGPPKGFDALGAGDRPWDENTAWCDEPRIAALKFQKNGSYLVIRKIGTAVSAFDAWLDAQMGLIADQTGLTRPAARALLKAAVLGRDEEGRALADTAMGDLNDFDYRADLAGLRCPHSAHIRRANPRRTEDNPQAPVEVRREFGRPTPRLMRRGMLFGQDKDHSKGLMFMAYAASISEQYEVIQRWLNGGNPTDVASGHNDPLTGIRPRDGEGSFRFIHQTVEANGSPKSIVLHVSLPSAQPLGGSEPGRHPFTPLYWGLYLFSPSRSALQVMANQWTGGYQPLGGPLDQALGKATIDRLWRLEPTVRSGEWERILNDFMTKDPSERDISPNVWVAIRDYAGGVLDIHGPLTAKAKARLEKIWPR